MSRFRQYDFYKDSNENKNPISLTLDDKTPSVLLFDSLDGKAKFMKMGRDGFLRGEALKAFKLLEAKSEKIT